MVLSDLLVLTVIVVFGILIWRHHNVRHRAYLAALQHTQQNGVLLLDQTIVLQSMKIRRSHSSLIAIERHFVFEFSSIGDERYKGELTFIGQRHVHIGLEPFRMYTSPEPLE